MLRIAAHGYNRHPADLTDRGKPACAPEKVGFTGRSFERRDVPTWYREMVGYDFKKLPIRKWSVDPEDPR